MAGMPTTDTPEWVRHAVFYQIFPDRFGHSERVPKAGHLEPWQAPPSIHGYKGGDLLAVVERLDYLKDLGVTALYLNPVFQSASNHRYHTHDYFRVDPMLGGDAALEALIAALHGRGMRLILDGVFNHASWGFFPFSDVLENDRDSAYQDWFHINHFPLNAYGEGEPGYEAWWDLPALPKLNTGTPAVREFLWRVSTYWLEKSIDGWRLDVPGEIDDDEFWREFRRRCRAVNPECYLVGEFWDSADRWLQGDQFDAATNYPLARAILGFVASDIDHDEVAKGGYHSIPRLDAASFATEVEQLLRRYHRAVTEVQFNLLGSHDTPRVRTVLAGDDEALRMAFLLLLIFPGAPCIYYGDEIGLEGGHDPDSRRAMPWSQEAWNRDLRTFIWRVIEVRSGHAALRTGSLSVLYAADDLLVFSRRAAAVFLAVLNVGPARGEVALEPASHEDMDGEYHDAVAHGNATVRAGRLLLDDLPGRSGLLFLRA